ncbi:DNA-directed RNA polymerases I [Entamoeba marina]
MLQAKFNVLSKDKGGKVFDTVSRFECETFDSMDEIKMFIDVNIDCFPLEVDDHIDVMVTKTINRDNSDMDQIPYTDDFGKNTYMDEYDYVMHGVVFKFVEEHGKLALIASFGGLLLMLYASSELLNEFNMDDKIFLLMKKD